MVNILNNVCFHILIVLLYMYIFNKLLFRFKPKNSSRLYSVVIAHRGFHMFAEENTLKAYDAAVKSNMAVELDVRMTKDFELVCFHDQYTKRILNIPGKINMFDLKTLKRYKIIGTDETVPTLSEALRVIDKKVEVLIEVKGNCKKEFLKGLEEIQNGYSKPIFFQTKNLVVYYKLKKIFKSIGSKEKRVYWIYNIFRKRFNFVKGKEYNSEVKKYNELVYDMDIELPSIEDISSIIVRGIEEVENKKEILATIGSIINSYKSRIKDKNHFVYNSLWIHRGILSDKYVEHSYESFVACKEFAKKNNINVTVEFDVMLYKGEVRCFHKDKVSSILGQDKSCAEKNSLSTSLRLSEILKIFNGAKNINLAIDIKDYHIYNRVLEDLIILEFERVDYKGNYIIMSYNPFVLSYFKVVKPEVLRAQIGHSLSGLRKVPIFRFPTILNGILGMLFDMSCADVVLFDDSKWIFYLIAYHKNVKGKPVLIYAPKSFIEQEAFIGRESIANFIVENVTDDLSWPKEYFEKFKNNK